MADDFAGWLVIKQDARRLVRELALDRLAVDAHLIGRHDALADVRRLAVHRYTPRDDQFFHVAARTHARLGEHLVELRRVVVRFQHAFLRGGLRPRRSIGARTPPVACCRRRTRATSRRQTRRRRPPLSLPGAGVTAPSRLPRFCCAPCRRPPSRCASFGSLGSFGSLLPPRDPRPLRAARLRRGIARRPGARFLARHAHLRDDYAVGRRFAPPTPASRRAFLGALRLRDGAAPGDQAARPATQAATRTVFALGGRRLVPGARPRLPRLRGTRLVGRGTDGALGFGRIGVVGMCQNNLKCVGSRARCGRGKKSADRFG